MLLCVECLFTFFLIMFKNFSYLSLGISLIPPPLPSHFFSLVNEECIWRTLPSNWILVRWSQIKFSFYMGDLFLWRKYSIYYWEGIVRAGAQHNERFCKRICGAKKSMQNAKKLTHLPSSLQILREKLTSWIYKAGNAATWKKGGNRIPRTIES